LFHVKHVVSAAEAAGISLTPGQHQRLETLAGLLAERAVPAGCIAEADVDRLYDRHILDCLRAAALFRKSDRTAYDIGSGAGLPGMVLAIALPACRFVLAEVKARRAAFLEYAEEQLGLRNIEVHAGAAEELGPGADVVTARAFAPLGRTWPLAAKLLRPGGRLIYFAGESLRDPVAAAEEAPGPPRLVTADPVLATHPPLVIMTRSERETAGGG
jgi:16S rRNA (guanine527-N7)-methyltransferase